MVRFVPYYTVTYRGEYHKGGQSFEIEDDDVEEMQQHGTIVHETAPAKRKPGRPKKVVDLSY